MSDQADGQAVQVGVVMGSRSDYETMQGALDLLAQHNIVHSDVKT